MKYEELLETLPGKIQSEREAANLLTCFEPLRKGVYALPRDCVVVCDISDLDEALLFYRGNEHKIKAFCVLGLREERKDLNVKILPLLSLTKEDNIHLYFRQDLRPACTPYKAISLFLSKLGIQEYTIEGHCLEKFYQRRSFIFIENNLQRAIDNYNVLEDSESRYTYLALWKSRLLQNPGFLPLAGYDQYWHPIVSAKEGDIICEGGPCEGSTTKEFSNRLHDKCTVISFEPDPQYLKEAQKNCALYPNISFVPKGLYDFTGTLYINSEFFNKVVKQKTSEQDYECPVTSIDDYFLSSSYSRVDFIKLDVEGAELNTMQGAKQILLRDKPCLAVSIYHNTLDFITVLNYLQTLGINYRYYMGHHRPWYTETVLYAVAT